MKKLKYILLVLFIFSFKNVYAVDKCTTEEMKRLKELANNVEVTYEFKPYGVQEVDGYYDGMYYVSILNTDPDLKYYMLTSYTENEIELNINDKEMMDDLAFNYGGNLTLKIYSYTDNLCTDTSLRTIKIDFPYYNQYYFRHQDKCEENPDFEYCEEFLKKENNLDDSEIDKLFDEYLGINNNDVQDSIFSNTNLIIIAAVLVLIASIVVFIIIRNKKRKADNNI